jgi:hypothetical protein
MSSGPQRDAGVHRLQTFLLIALSHGCTAEKWRRLRQLLVLMLADELTANLAAKRGQEVAQLLREKTLEMNKTVLMVSNERRIPEVADRAF